MQLCVPTPDWLFPETLSDMLSGNYGGVQPFARPESHFLDAHTLACLEIGSNKTRYLKGDEANLQLASYAIYPKQKVEGAQKKSFNAINCRTFTIIWEWAY